MHTTMHIRSLIGYIIIIAIAILIGCQAMAITPAGTTISAKGSATYNSSSGISMPTVTSNTVTTTVSQVASVNITPATGGTTTDSNNQATFAITITNAGNGSDTFDLSSASASGASISIYRDANNDGQWQSTETTVLTNTGALSAGTSIKCMIVVRPSGSLSTSAIVTVSAKSRFDTTKSANTTLTVQPRGDISAYIRTWLLNGYYSNTNSSTRLSQDYLGGEAGVAPSQGTITAGKSWTTRTYSTEVIDLTSAFGAQTYCAAYAHVYVYSPTSQSVNLWLGSDNGIKVWVNGTNIWTNDSTRGLTIDQDKRVIDLNSGWNRLLIKVSQYGGNWAFTARLCDSAGNAISGIKYAIEPPDTEAPVISNVAVVPGSDTATVTWSTDEPSTTMVDFGTTADLGQKYSNSTMVTQHEAQLTGLTPDTTYNLKVGSVDSSGNSAWSGNYSFQTTSSPVASPYIQEWLANAYYSNTNTGTRLSTDYLGGEGSVMPYEGSLSGGKTWVKLASEDGRYIDLAKAGNYPTYCAGYAHVYVYSPQAQAVSLWLGSDNGIKVWVNGTVIWTNDSTRGYTADQDKVPVNLNAGWNRILLKISQYGGNWGFSAKLCDTAGNTVPGLRFAAEPEGMFIKSWLLNGYYRNTNTATRLSTDYLGGESGVIPVQGTSSGGHAWFAVDSQGSVVDLVDAFGAQTYCAGYAYVYVNSPVAQNAELRLGSDNGIKAWLNGSLIWTNDSTRGLTPDQDRIPISLSPGWNRLLLKISQYGGNWAFTSRICDANGNPLPDLQYAVEP